jgi:septum formation protein
MNPTPLILASASPRRAQLLQSAGLEFLVLPAQVFELQPDHLTPHEAVQINAYRKARVVAKQHPDAIVIGADTEVVLDRRVFGKPSNLEEAQQMLASLQGQTHEVITGVCLIHLRAHWQSLFAASTLVTFRPLNAAQIRDYLARTQPLDKAGAYAIQEEGHLIVEALDGSFTNVVGLPMARLLAELTTLSADEPVHE